MHTQPTYASIHQKQRGTFDQFYPGGKTLRVLYSWWQRLYGLACRERLWRFPENRRGPEESDPLLEGERTWEAIISTGVRKFITHSLYGGIRGNAKWLRKSFVQHGCWDERRIELEIVFLFGPQAQCVNVVFDLLILLGLLAALDSVRFCSTGEIRSQSNRVDEQTWRIISFLLRWEVVDMDTPRTVSCYVIGHNWRLWWTYDRERSRDISSTWRTNSERMVPSSLSSSLVISRCMCFNCLSCSTFWMDKISWLMPSTTLISFLRRA